MMMMRHTATLPRRTALTLALGGWAMATPALAAGPCDDVVFFEGFESATTTLGFETFSAGETFESDSGLFWLVENNNIEVVNNLAEPGNFRSFEGDYAVDLAGRSFGTISIEIPVEIGREYVLSFRYARNGGTPRAAADYAVVSGAGQLVSGSVTHDIGFADYLEETAAFAATAETITLRFENTGGGSRFGIALDAVSLTRLAEPCRVDLDGDCEATLFDFLEFQNLFSAGDPAADFDGDGTLTLFDFLAFQNAFAAGCP